LVTYFLNLIKGSAQRELDSFFSVIYPDDSLSQQITKSALSQARKKLSPKVFMDLNQLVVDTFYGDTKTTSRWKGFRLCAVDGSQFRLPNVTNIVEAFGVHKGKESQKSCSMALVSMYYDVLNEIIIDASINPPYASERTLAFEHLTYAQKDDLVLYDRGYPAFWLFAAHQDSQVNFCMRVKSNLEMVYKSFVESGKREMIIEMKPNKPSIVRCQEKGLSIKPIKLRLVRVDLKKETEVLVTNILDDDIVRTSDFKALYHLRWGIEENYKRQKQWLEIDNFSGKSELAIKQDFFAKLVTHNLTAITVRESQKLVSDKIQSRRRNYKVNFAQALSKMKDTIISLLHHSGFHERLQKLIDFCAQTVEAIRPGRSFPRNIKNKKQNNIRHISYKRCK